MEKKEIEELVEEKIEERLQGWIHSEDLLKRSLAVYGHSLLAGIVITLALFLIGFIFGLFL